MLLQMRNLALELLTALLGSCLCLPCHSEPAVITMAVIIMAVIIMAVIRLAVSTMAVVTIAVISMAFMTTLASSHPGQGGLGVMSVMTTEHSIEDCLAAWYKSGAVVLQ